MYINYNKLEYMNHNKIIVKVFNDMGHLNYHPNSLPNYITNQIQNDVKATYPVIDGITLCIYKILPNVPQKRQMDNYVIEYELDKIKLEDFPVGKQIPGNNFLCVIDNLFTPAECQNLIIKANNVQNEGYNKSWHPANTGGGYMRVMMIDRDLSNQLWSKIKKFLPRDLMFNGYKLVYLNDHFRFSRYKKGGKFPLHCDGSNYDASRPEESGGYSTQSLLTLNIFLNDGFLGGETDFLEHNSQGELTLRETVKPKVGRSALFWANQYHRGNEVIPTDDVEFKYLLRTDVMGI